MIRLDDSETAHTHPQKTTPTIFGCNIMRGRIEGHYGRYWIAGAIFNLDHPIVRKAMSQLLYETRDAKMHLKCMRTIQISYIDCRGHISSRFYNKSVAYNFFESIRIQILTEIVIWRFDCMLLMYARHNRCCNFKEHFRPHPF